MRAMKIMSIAAILAIGTGLSACGHSEGDRALTGVIKAAPQKKNSK